MVDTPTGTTTTTAPNSVVSTFEIKVPTEQLPMLERIKNMFAGTGATIAQASTSMRNLGEDSELASVMLTKFSASGSVVGQVFDNATAKLSAFIDELGATGDISKSNVVVMSALTNAVGKVRDSFQGSWDFKGLNTFTNQLKSLGIETESNPSKLKQLGGALGLTGEAMDKAGGKLKQLILNTAASADNALKLRDVMIGAGAASGSLGSMVGKTGDGIKNINETIREQRKAMLDASAATHTSIDVVESYYTQLARLPGVLNMTLDETKKLGSTTGGMGLMTTAINLAKGSGMDYADVVKNMHVAIRNYSASIPDALTFTARISELNKKYGIELEDVRNELVSTSEAFKMFGKDMSSGAQIMNQYVGALKGTGISGAAATEIVGNMTKQISQLTIAQKAFLSAQSGGPGGLMGGFKIDMMMREEGGIKKVMDMAMNTMKRQMGGQMVSTAEAANSPQAAAQMTKQIALLQQGPLGAFAKDQQSAERIIDAIKSGDTETINELSKTAVQDVAKEGVEWQKQSATGINRLVEMAQQARGMAEGGSLSLLQSGSTAGAGEAFEGEENSTNIGTSREFLTDSMKRSGAGEILRTQGQKFVDQSGAFAFQTVDDFRDFFNHLGPMLKAPVEGIMNLLKEGKGTEAQATYKDFLADIEKRKEEIKNMPKAAQAAALAKLSQEGEAMKASMGFLSTNGGDISGPMVGPQLGGVSDLGVPMSVAGDQVGQAAGRNASRAGANNGPTDDPNSVLRPTGGGPVMGEITVHNVLEAQCIDCHTKNVMGSSQRARMTPTAK